MKTVAKLLLAVLLLLTLIPSAHAASRMEAARRLDVFRNFFLDFQQAPDAGIPGDLLADCYGVIIMSQFKAGFIFGGEYGEGVVLMHNRFTNEWSAPAFVRSASGSWGLQAGGQQTDAIILIMNQEGVDMLLRSRFTVGVDASAAAGPVGRDLAASIGPGTSLLTYSRARGLFGGATLGGGALFNNDAMNRVLYGGPIRVRDIVEGGIQPPPEAYGLIDALRSYARKNYVDGPPPPRPAPGPYYNDAPSPYAPPPPFPQQFPDRQPLGDAPPFIDGTPENLPPMQPTFQPVPSPYGDPYRQYSEPPSGQF